MRLVALAALGSLFALFLGFGGAIHPAFDTLSHFRAHLAVCLLFGGLLLMFTRKRAIGILAIIGSVTGIYASSEVFPISAEQIEADGGKPVYALYHINLLWIHDNPQQVIDQIEREDAELLSIAEASRRWEPHLSGLRKRWPHFFNCPEKGPRGGVRIYSKWPLNASDDYCGPYGSFGKTAARTPDGGTITVASTHFRWPWPASGPEQLNAVMPHVRAIGSDALIAGDFNATPWSHMVRAFAEAGDLGIVPGIGPTWLFTELPSFLIGVIGFPIDNVLHKGRVRVLEARSLPFAGSDHLPVVVRFQLD